MGRPPLNPTGPMTAAERQARRRKRVGKSINRRRRTLYKIATESETRKAKRARRDGDSRQGRRANRGSDGGADERAPCRCAI